MATFDLFRMKSLTKDEKLSDKNRFYSTHKICLKKGAITSLLLAINFLFFCGFTGHLEIHDLSIMNMFILAVGAFFAISAISPTGKGGSVDYFEGFKISMYASSVAVVSYALFLLVYTSVYPTVLLTNGYIFGAVSNPFTVAGVTILEGFPAVVIITFCLMQYFKRD